MANQYKITKKGQYRAKDFDPADTGKFKDRQEAETAMEKNLVRINELQQKLYADGKEGVVFLFQAMDAAGKDGTIRAVLSCLSPQGVTESSFKVPSSTELAHDYLWRIANCLPEKGQIAIFNRSHYEDVLVGKVHKLYENYKWADRIDRDKIIDYRYEDIRNWETYLYHNSIRMVKIFLNVSKEEQAERFLSRLQEEKKNWKFGASDMKEREYWDEYQKAFEDAVNETATSECPWYVVPADHKWYMRWLVSQIIVDTLEEMDPKWPEVDEEDKAEFKQYEEQLIEIVGQSNVKEKKVKDKNIDEKIKDKKNKKTKKEKKSDKKEKDKKNKKKKKEKAVADVAEVIEENDPAPDAKDAAIVAENSIPVTETTEQ